MIYVNINIIYKVDTHDNRWVGWLMVNRGLFNESSCISYMYKTRRGFSYSGKRDIFACDFDTLEGYNILEA